MIDHVARSTPASMRSMVKLEKAGFSLFHSIILKYSSLTYLLKCMELMGHPTIQSMRVTTLIVLI